MTLFDKIKHQLKEPDKYGNFYLDNELAIEDCVRNFSGVKTDLFLTDLEKELDNLRFCTIFSDLTNVYPTSSSGEMNILVPNTGSRKVTLSTNILSSVIHKNGSPVLHPAYLVRNSKELSNLFNKIEPLIESELVIVHNARMIMGLTQENTDNSPRHWQMFDVAPNSPTGNWMVMEKSEQNSTLPINFTPVGNNQKDELLDITIPYLKGISFKELSKILKDNSDLLSSFRKKVRDIIEQAKLGNLHLDEIKNDIIRPEVDKISSTFKKIQNIHKLKVAGTTFSMLTVGLVSFSVSEIGQIVASFLGAGGLGLLIKNEVEYQEAISKLTENPLYLMWELKRAKKTGA